MSSLRILFPGLLKYVGNEARVKLQTQRKIWRQLLVSYFKLCELLFELLFGFRDLDLEL